MIFTAPNCLVRVKGVKDCAQQSMSDHCQLAVGSEFCQFGKKSGIKGNDLQRKIQAIPILSLEQ